MGVLNGQTVNVDREGPDSNIATLLNFRTEMNEEKIVVYGNQRLNFD